MTKVRPVFFFRNAWGKSEMQLPFDQILGKNNPLKLPDVAAVEAGNRYGPGSLHTDTVTTWNQGFGAGWYANPQEKGMSFTGQVIHFFFLTTSRRWWRSHSWYKQHWFCFSNAQRLGVWVSNKIWGSVSFQQWTTGSTSGWKWQVLWRHGRPNQLDELFFCWEVDGSVPGYVLPPCNPGKLT